MTDLLFAGIVEVSAGADGKEPAMKPLSAVQIGLGHRGITHIDAMLKQPENYRLTGFCNRSAAAREACRERYGLPEEVMFADAEEMLAVLRPEVVSFATQPADRLAVVKLCARYGVRGILMEKPVAQTWEEAKELFRITEEAGIKTAVCHQHKYLRSFQALKRVLDSSELGEVTHFSAQCQQHAGQIATHYIDYVLWAAGDDEPVSVIGHVHGNFHLADSHPSPDMILGEIAFASGRRAYVECGYFAPPHQESDSTFSFEKKTPAFYTDNRLTVFGTTGYAYAGCNGDFAVFSAATGGKRVTEEFGPWREECVPAQEAYMADFAAWLRGEKKDHPCCLRKAMQGAQVLEGIYRSALMNTRVDLPLADGPAADLTELTPVPYRRLPVLVI